MILGICYTKKMEKMCRKYKKEIALMLAFGVIIVLLLLIPNHKIVERVSADPLDRTFSFGLAQGFYEEDIVLELSTNDFATRNAVIYYTTDGSVPTMESERYAEPLRFTATDALDVVALQASVYMDGEVVGGPYRATYFLSKNKAAFNDIMLVSIVADEEDLFGEEKGILHPAVSYVTTGVGDRWNQMHAENFAQSGDEWVRTANVTVFEGSGQKVIEQDCGISVSGNHGSLTHYPFSLKIKADHSYDAENNVFAYNPFQGVQLNSAQQNYYDSLAFKNGGNDYAWGELRDDVKGTMLKTTVGARMARELGLAASEHRIAIVYLNGEFYNLTSLVANVNPKTIAVYTGLDDDKIITGKAAERACLTDFEIKSMYHSFPDMADSDIFEERDTFESKVDMRDLFRYYAFELIVGNPDWPQNNYAMWRYTGEPQEGNDYSDGKFRFWVFDLDCMYNTQDWMMDPWEAIFEETRGENCLIPILIQIDDYEAQFVNTVLDLLNSSVFQEEYIYQIIDEEDNAFSPWYTWLYGAEAEQERQANIELFKQNVAARRQRVLEYLNEYFQVESLYTAEVLAAGGNGKIHFNSMELEDGGFVGSYSEKYPLMISYEENSVDKIDYWLVNGERIDTEVLTVTGDMVRNEKVTIQPVIK